jgi:hypothetical protein
MLTGLQPGAEVEHNGMEIGSVERVVDGEILVRLGRADYLLRIPEQYLRVESPQRVELADDLDLDEVERTAIDSGRAPPTGEVMSEAEPTEATPNPERVAGRMVGMPPSYDGPATG